MRWRQLPTTRKWLPQLQCHRGYWVDGLSQNTLDSVKKAYELHYEMVEFDVRLTRDLEVVLFHDELCHGKNVSKLSLVELRRLKMLDQVHVSTLEEIFIWFSEMKSQNKIFNFKLNIEIKSKLIFDSNLERLVCKLIKKYKLEQNILISSFNPFSLFRFKKLDDNIIRALLLSEDVESNFILKYMILNTMCCPDVLHLRFQDFNHNRYIKLNKKIPVVLWTVNDMDFYQKNKDYIHGVISDEITPQRNN